MVRILYMCGWHGNPESGKTRSNADSELRAVLRIFPVKNFIPEYTEEDNYRLFKDAALFKQTTNL